MLNKLKNEVFGKKRNDAPKSRTGERMRQTWREKIDENGKKILVEDDYYDQQEVIQSWEESVNVNNIIERYMAGDETALNRAKAFYADVSKVPKNMAAMLELNNRAQIEFQKLPNEVQELFNYSYFEFLNNPQILDEYMEKNYKEHVKSDVVEDVKDVQTSESAD